MTAETENLVLELLRGMRSDIAELKGDVSSIRERVEAIEMQLEGIRYILAASVGSIATDLKDHETRIAALEGARV